MHKLLSVLSILFFLSCTGQVEKSQISDVVNQDQWTTFLSEKESAQIIDVRTPEEYAQGYLPNALNINFYDADFMEKMNKALDKDRPVFIYCKSGGRSGKARGLLKEAGYIEVYDLRGGYSGWKP